jgi:hypothetical protein
MEQIWDINKGHILDLETTPVNWKFVMFRQGLVPSLCAHYPHSEHCSVDLSVAMKAYWGAEK